MVHAFGRDERTVADWRDRGGQHSQQIHEAMVEQGQLDLMHVQADEIRGKGRTMVAWMGLATMISTRRWLAGTVSQRRDKGLADALRQPVGRTARKRRPLLVLTDGWAAYPGRMCRAFREKVQTTPGPGRACVQVGPPLHMGTIITRTEKKRVVDITRTMARGLLEDAQFLLTRSGGGENLTTAFLERLHGTVRERLASLTRNSRHAASRLHALRTGRDLIGGTYHFGVVHQERSKEKPWGKHCPPAIASGRTDPAWSVGEWLWYKVAPTPWAAPTRRGPRPKHTAHHAGVVKQQHAFSRVRPLLRLRTGVFCSTTGS
ncbi:MAG TPA: hypothetical protein VGF67_33180 [Ktedonobacteraceae bacterium]|jgi:hypothetical protein